MDDGSVKELQQCHIDFPLPEGDKKGWEGAEYLDKGPAGEFLLGLCEGNHCEVSIRSLCVVHPSCTCFAD